MIHYPKYTNYCKDDMTYEKFMDENNIIVLLNKYITKSYDKLLKVAKEDEKSLHLTVDAVNNAEKIVLIVDDYESLEQVKDDVLKRGADAIDRVCTIAYVKKLPISESRWNWLWKNGELDKAFDMRTPFVKKEKDVNDLYPYIFDFFFRDSFFKLELAMKDLLKYEGDDWLKKFLEIELHLNILYTKMNTTYLNDDWVPVYENTKQDPTNHFILDNCEKLFAELKEIAIEKGLV